MPLTGRVTFMDLSIPPELRQLKDLVRLFVTRELAPLEQIVDEQDHIDADTMVKLRQRAVELGVYGFNLPADIGGGGMSALGDVLVSGEMGRASGGVAEAIGRLPQALAVCNEGAAKGPGW